MRAEYVNEVEGSRMAEVRTRRRVLFNGGRGLSAVNTDEVDRKLKVSKLAKVRNGPAHPPLIETFNDRVFASRSRVGGTSGEDVRPFRGLPSPSAPPLHERGLPNSRYTYQACSHILRY